MHESTLSSYEEVPYLAKPLYPTHPDCVGTMATLLGMTPAPPPACRVLELGCATGGNLIPMAVTLPNSSFVGIDLSPRQVQMGQELIDRLGLTNITLKALSILDVGDDFGTFDYILCHGVYSWVPSVVRDKILSICKHCLAPQGIAYISYNTYPGWHARGVARDLMRFHSDQFTDPATRIQQARAFLGFMAQAAPDQDGYFARVLREEVEFLEKAPDQYVFHEHLEDSNQPCYFTEFMSRASSQGLQYLAESWFHCTLDSQPPEVAETLQQVSADLMRLEQYLDFLTNRKFRRTLLCHEGVVLNRTPAPAIIERFHLSALARPMSAQVDLGPDKAELFKTDDGAKANTNIPLVKAALLVLYEAWPRFLPFEELWVEVARRVPPPPGGREFMSAAVLQLYLSNGLALHLQAPAFTLTIAERPRASPLARVQAESNEFVTNLRHRLVRLNEGDRQLLRRLDGTHDRSTLADVPDLDAALGRLARGSLLLASKAEA